MSPRVPSAGGPLGGRQDASAPTREGEAKRRSSVLISETESVIRSAMGPSSLDAPRRIIDHSTGLPSLTSLFDDFLPTLEASPGTSVFYIHIPSSAIVEERFGGEALEAYRALISTYLAGFTQNLRRDRAACVLSRMYADDFVIVASAREGDEQLPSVLADGMTRHLSAIDEETASLMQVYVGHTQGQIISKIHPERMLYRLIQRAQTEATDVGRQRISAHVRVLDRCIAREQFNMLYQPIVRMSDHAIFAYEALVRCSQKELKSPHVLFNVAEQGDRIHTLSLLLRRIAISAAPDLPDDAHLFVNLHPKDIEDSDLLHPHELIEEHGPRLVFEITERAAVQDFDSFMKKIGALRDMGAKIAVDDLGSGYSALNMVAELAPDFIKLDMTLIRNIHESSVRQNLVRSMISFATDLGAEVVGEGVETRPELQALADLGCHLVQGFYLSHPAPPFVTTIKEPPATPIR